MTIPAQIVFAADRLQFVYQSTPARFLQNLEVGEVGWGMADSGLFAIEVDGERIDAMHPDLVLQVVNQTTPAAGQTQTQLTFAYAPLHLTIDFFVMTYSGATLCESWIVVKNYGTAPQTITRLDSLVLHIPSASYDMLHYTGGWGSEFEPVRGRINGDVRLETRAGRSSQGMHPWCTLWRDGRSAMSVSVAWSGNWAIRLAEQADGGFELSAGLNEWAYFSVLDTNQSVTAPKVAWVLNDNPSLNDLAQQYATIGRKYWYPHAPLADAMPVEWNHWWTYEDRAINEEVFRANVDVAAKMGMEVCALDAGWFGPSDPGTHWYDYRGDWHNVNTRRFPSGIRALADYTHQHGMAFGLWCEIEALGRHAEAAKQHPAIVATRHSAPLGYVCLGSDAGWQWAYDTLDRLITDYAADWIKLDFNLDPGAGCDRTDHGHGAGDGLLCHYHGYYRLLQAIRDAHPHVVLENCSSGGLRIDLGLARQTHMAFLSDPDWPEHSLQLFWGAATMLAPDALLHWGFCEWGFADHPQQTFDPQSKDLTVSQLDYYTRIGMLRRFGFSQGLPTLLPWVADRYVQHINDYKNTIRRFVKYGVLHLQTNQPRRDGTLDRYAAFQYVLADSAESLLAVFRLPGAKPRRVIPVTAIEPELQYELTWLGDNRVQIIAGADLVNGLHCDDLPEPGAVMILIRAIRPA
jgi:alpha-galactosidase